MKKLLAVTIMILFISVSVIPSTGTTDVKQIVMPATSGNTLYVGGNGTGNYSSIQDAIDDSSSGDTVYVYDDSSPYYENVVVDKSINLVGEDKNITIIDGIHGHHTLRIVSNNVTVKGLTIQNSSEGILIRDYNDNIIEGNKFSNNEHSIKLQNSLRNKIIGNIVFNNSGDGISLHHCIKNDIKDNIISNNNWSGFVLFGSHNNNISGNIITDNNFYGYYSFESDNVTIFGNTFLNHNDSAIHVGYSSNNTVSKNIIINSTGGGIKFCHSHYKNIIIRNTLINNNRYGINLWNCTNHEIFWNNVSQNYIGILLSVANNNNIYSNNFIQNNKNAEFRMLSLHNKWNGNYWSNPRTLPYPIIGRLGLFIPSWVNFDWHPAQEPYDIEV